MAYSYGVAEDILQTSHTHPPSILYLVSKLGKRSKLVFLCLIPNITKRFQIYYGQILWDLKHPNRPHTLNGRIRKLIWTCY